MRKVHYKWALAILLIKIGCVGEPPMVSEGIAEQESPLASRKQCAAGLDEGKLGVAGMLTGDKLEADARLEGARCEAGESDDDDSAGPRAVGKMRVKSPSLKVRKGPGSEFPVVRVLKKGAMIEIEGGQGEWVKIGSEQYVSRRYLDKP